MPKALSRVIGLGTILVVGLLAGKDALLQAAGDFLVVNDPLRRVDAVVVISGNNPERVRTASRLMRDGYGGWLVISGGARPARQMAEMARREGVSYDRMLIDANATSTWQNAIGAARVMQAAELRTAILVTSPYHMRRAITLFRQAFRSRGLTVSAYSVPDSLINLHRWWQRPKDREFVLRELVKVAALLIGIR